MLDFLSSLARVTLMRGSPERILYDRWLLRGGLACAVVFSALAQLLFYQDHLVFVILRVFAEITMFMLWMVLLTAKVARLRLATAMMCLLWISAVADALLALIGLLPIAIDPLLLVSGVVGVVAAYGAANCVSWALRQKIPYAAMHVLGYIVAVTLLDLAFRELYAMMLS